MGILILVFFTTTAIFSQTDWYKYPGNPVINAGPAGSRDAIEAAPDFVIYHNGVYRMWYEGVDSKNFRKVGLATSSDGINWIKDPRNPVFTGGPDGSWDDFRVILGSIVIKDSIYHMWYAGSDGTKIGAYYENRIGYATSTDSGDSWVKHPAPVLNPGSTGEWDDYSVARPRVIFDNDTLKLWYTGRCTTEESRVGYAWSLDGISWTKYNDPATTNAPYIESDPVMKNMQNWEGKGNGSAWVIKNDSQFEMWYRGLSSSIGYATSGDGIIWNKYTGNPVLKCGSLGEWDKTEIYSPIVYMIDSLNKMWYSGWDGSRSRIGYAIDVTNIAHAKSLVVYPSYIDLEGDTLIVTSLLSNIKNHPTLVYAFINGEGTAYKDSVELFDDGLHSDGESTDNIYGGKKWLSGLPEDMYTIELSITDLTSEIKTLYPLLGHFTNSGPIKIYSIEYSPYTNNRYLIKPFIRNESASLTFNDLQIKLYSDDPWITEIYPTIKGISSISPGETISNIQTAVSYDSAAFPGYFNLKFDISMDGWTYWKDSIKAIVTGVEEVTLQPLVFKLEQNYPNPFNPITTIKYSIPKQSYVTLKIHDILGTEVGILVDEEKPAGTYEVTWDAKNFASGVYFYQLKSEQYVQTKKLILLK